MNFAPVQALLDAALEAKVFPSYAAGVASADQVLFRSSNVPEETAFDLASLTKVMATAPLALEAMALKKWTPETAVGDFFEQAASARCTVRDLLFHCSGLPAFVPLFNSTFRAFPSLREANCPGEVRVDARAWTVSHVLDVSPERGPREQAVYSDLGFILLGEMLSRLWNAPLEALFRERVAHRLGLGAAYCPVSRMPAEGWAHHAVTGKTRPREPAPAQVGLWPRDERAWSALDVDDDNAWVLNGVSGHAGLFAKGEDVLRFGQGLLRGAWLPPEGWRADAFTPGSTRTWGFDLPAPEGSSLGSLLGRGPRGAMGHLGFTGTSLWVDWDAQIAVVLLTNRVAMGRAHVEIQSFRPRFHDAVAKCLGMGPEGA